MANAIKNNAYHVLGLDTTASDKEILKRSKEIINQLKIDNVPQYDLDPGVFDNYRTEASVNEAAQKLQSQKKRLKDYLFWFQIGDDVDEKAFKLIKEKDFSGAIQTWQEAAEGSSSKSLLYKKNLAVLLTVMLAMHDDKKILSESLSAWKVLFDSDKFWSAFEKVYRLHADQTAGQDAVADLRQSATGCLSDIYAELHELHKDAAYINEFQKIFSVKGERVEKQLLGPAYQAINEAVEGLEGLKVSEDEKLDEEEIAKIKQHIQSIQGELNKLVDLGLYEDSQTKVMRDRAADAIKSIVLDLHNNLSETDKAISLLGIALKIVGTSGLESKIKQDIKTLEDVKKNADIVKPIIDLQEREEFEEALKLIDSEQKKYPNNEELQKFYTSQKKLCITTLAAKKYKQARDKFDNNNVSTAKGIFEECGQMIYSNIELFDFNKKAIDEMIKEFKETTPKFNAKNLEEFDEYRDSYVKVAKEKFEGQLEQMALIVLIDSYLFAGISDFMQRYKHKLSVVGVLYKLGWLTIWFYGFGLLFFIGGWLYKNSD